MADWKSYSREERDQMVEDLTPRVIELKSRGNSWDFIQKDTGLPRNIISNILKEGGMLPGYETGAISNFSNTESPSFRSKVSNMIFGRHDAPKGYIKYIGNDNIFTEPQLNTLKSLARQGKYDEMVRYAKDNYKILIGPSFYIIHGGAFENNQPVPSKSTTISKTKHKRASLISKHEEIREKFKAGARLDELCKEYGASKGTIGYILSKKPSLMKKGRGDSIHPFQPKYQTAQAEMLSLHKQGLSYGRIAKKFGISKATTYSVIKREEAKERKEHRKSMKTVESSGNTPKYFTVKDVQLMKSLRASGKTLKQIADIMHCTKPTVWYHMHNKSEASKKIIGQQAVKIVKRLEKLGMPRSVTSEPEAKPKAIQRNLTLDEKKTIRRLASEGLNSYQIAKQISRSQSTVYFFMKRFGIHTEYVHASGASSNTLEIDPSLRTVAQAELERFKNVVQPPSAEFKPDAALLLSKEKPPGTIEYDEGTLAKKLNEYQKAIKTLTPQWPKVKQSNIGRPKHDAISLKEAGIEIVSRAEAGLEPTVTEIAMTFKKAAETLTETNALIKKFKNTKDANAVRSRLYEELDINKFNIKMEKATIKVYLK